MKNKRVFTLLCICLFSLILASPAQAGRFFVGAGAGTLGFGADLGYQFSNWLKFRLNANYLPIDVDDVEIHDVDYDAEFRNLTAGLLVDVHPFFGEFRITAGVYYRDMSVDIKATPNKSIKIGDNYYDPSDFGRADGEITWDKFAPYLGIGWGLSSGTDMDFSFDINLGVMYMSGVDVDYKITDYTGMLPINDFRADIDREARKIKDEIDDYKFYPVISLFFSFRF